MARAKKGVSMTAIPTALVQSAIAGDRQAQGQLWTASEGLAKATLHAAGIERAELDDVLATVAVKVLAGLAKLRDEDAYAAWLAEVTRGVAVDWQRKQTRERRALQRGESVQRREPKPVTEGEQRALVLCSIDNVLAREAAPELATFAADVTKASEALGRVLEAARRAIRGGRPATWAAATLLRSNAEVELITTATEALRQAFRPRGPVAQRWLEHLFEALETHPDWRRQAAGAQLELSIPALEGQTVERLEATLGLLEALTRHASGQARLLTGKVTGEARLLAWGKSQGVGEKRVARLLDGKDANPARLARTADRLKKSVRRRKTRR
ncbi:MAG: hypothetical protein V2A73_20235 [Pseudomonadota bacterium]